MREAAVAITLIAAALLSDNVSAGTFVLRSPGTGAISAQAPAPTTPIPPDPSSGFALSITGETSVRAGAALDLRPIVSGASGRTSFLLLGNLPIGATFDASTGRIAGRALKAGSYPIWVLAGDSAGATVTAGLTIVVT